MRFRFWILSLGLLLGACAQNQAVDNEPHAITKAGVRSILMVPVINESVEVNAPDYFLSTIVKPMAERGYYVFPVNLVKRIMEDDGLSDANMVHEADPVRLAGLFGADAVLYVTINRWDARYILLSTTVTVQFTYILKNGKDGGVLWRDVAVLTYTPDSNSNTGNAFANLVAAAVTAAIAKAAPNYMPLTRQANQNAANHIPPGPYAERADKGR